MKKWLIGCGIALFIAIVLCGAGLIFAFYKTAQVMAGFQESAEQVQVLSAKHPFSPPDDGVADPERLKTYFEIRESIAKKVYGNNAFIAITQELQGGKANVNVSMSEIFGLIFTFSREVIEDFARQLDKHQMSPEEYIFLAESSYAVIAEGQAKGLAEFTSVYDTLKASTDRLSTEMQKNNHPQLVVDFDAMMQDFADPELYPISTETVETVRSFKDQINKYPHLGFIEFLLIQHQYQFRGAVPPAGVNIERAADGSYRVTVGS